MGCMGKETHFVKSHVLEEGGDNRRVFNRCKGACCVPEYLKVGPFGSEGSGFGVANDADGLFASSSRHCPVLVLSNAWRVAFEPNT